MDDAKAIFAMAKAPAVSEYLQWSPHSHVKETVAFIEETDQMWRRGTAYIFGIFDRRTGAAVGSTGINTIDRPNLSGEIGTWIGIPFQGSGFNIPSKAALFHIAFAGLGMQRVEMLVREDNERSLAAMAKLPGVELEGTLRSRLRDGSKSYDAKIFGLTADSYDQSQYPDVHIDGSISVG